MKTSNLVILFMIMIACLFSTDSFAQQEVCSIRYSYDKTGARTKREYKCEIPSGPGTPAPWTDYGGVISRIYPVPTPGLFHVEFSTTVTSAYLYVIDMNGTQLLDFNVSQATTIVDFDLTPYVPGTYILTAIFGTAMESYTITKL